MADPVTTATIAPRKARADDLPELTRTLSEAFFADPVFTWWIPEDGRRREILPEFFAAIVEANLAHDEIYAVADLVAGAVWNPPDVEGDDEALVAELGARCGEYADTLYEVFELMGEVHPQGSHYYLFFLGTRPQWQSRGLGSALMRPVLQACDERRLPAYLEATCERNVKLYQRHGFELTGEIPLPDGPSLWPMWREPR
jgi:GNAT superfamily N-acetyltransferase